MRKSVYRVFDKVQHKPGCTTAKDALKFRIREVEGFYYLLSENKGFDQLHGYCIADLRLF